MGSVQCLSDSDIEAVCLYRGDKARELADVAPYLVSLLHNDPFSRWLLNSGCGKSWGIFLESSATLSQLKRHFRTFLMVYLSIFAITTRGCCGCIYRLGEKWCQAIEISIYSLDTVQGGLELRCFVCP
jgi:hypothetical protein